MSKFSMTLLPEYFDKIKKGEKIYEVRLNKNKYKDIKINDFITFNKKPDLNEFIETKVDDILYFSTFNEMINSLYKELIGFKNHSKNEIINVYKEIYPNEKEEKEFGIVVYKIFII